MPHLGMRGFTLVIVRRFVATRRVVGGGRANSGRLLACPQHLARGSAEARGSSPNRRDQLTPGLVGGPDKDLRREGRTRTVRAPPTTDRSATWQVTSTTRDSMAPTAGLRA